MTPASIHFLKKELQTLTHDKLQEICIRLAKYKKENKELLTYLLLDTQDEDAYVENVKEEIEVLFQTIPSERNVYFVKKTLRKILRFLNRQINYSGVHKTELELRIFFCEKIIERRIPIKLNSVISNLYEQQVKKINELLMALPEDLQGDYECEVTALHKIVLSVG